MSERIIFILCALGALLLAPLVVAKCATALYSGLVLGDFSYVEHLASSLEFAIECLLLDGVAVLLFIGDSCGD